MLLKTSILAVATALFAMPSTLTAQQPSQPCNTGPYIVFFEWNDSELSREAREVLDDVVNFYAACGTASVLMAGHADRSQPVRQSVKISQERVDAVAEYLVSKGLPGSRMASAALGSSQPRVETPDGVREMENRRVEINFAPPGRW
ncbi:OmpA family protein [Sphingomicrobium sediminis]|uniref:OmpA family protein n=1 Tax=Sphingomicrobium sediminis TaxID=2950949 RepID=A0A9X2EFT8_9SPHN|nr:OmpA family protein [Sphingomicrobium sediminis]MCM8556611.1 OmpA family protein [Sphingomicrobium sediminis]